MRKNEEVFDTSTLLGNVTDDENYAPYEPEEGYEDYAWDEDFYGEDLPDEEGEGFIDEEVIGKDADEDLQLAYAGYSSDYETLVSLLGEILESGEFTEENKENLNTINDDYDESYALVKEEIINAQNMVLENKITEIKNTMLTGTQDAVFDALTNNGEVQGLFKDEDGQIYLNAKFLQTRGMQVVNEDNEVTLSIDDDGNLTTSGDIVGGTITGAVMNAMTINTDTVNITSEDGAMTLEGAMQKFSDENGNVRIKIGKDTDGTFKFVLYGDDGESVLIDKNGIKASAISMGTINIGHLNADVINTIDAKIDNATIDKATIGQLDATNAKIENLKAENATIKNLVAEKADITDLNATNATIGNLNANKADITELNAVKGNISQLESEIAKIGTIESDVANIEHILAGNITAENIQTGAITAGSGVIADGAIGSAQISSLDASKITAGKIDTSKVEVAGTNNHLRIKGNRIQVFQGTGSSAKERVSLGDVNGNGSVYGLRVRGADGTTILLDENGVKSEGITDGAITNDKISDDANIDGAKLNINSVVSKLNEDGTETINGTKIEVDGTNLNTKLSSITNKQTADGEKITQAQTQITANTNAIKLKVDNQTYQTDKSDMTSKLNKNTSEISAMKGQIALKVEQTDIDNASNVLKSEIKTELNEVHDRIDGILDNVGGAIADGIIDESETIMINSSITQLNKEKETLTQRYNYIYNLSTLSSSMKSSLKTTMDNYNSKQSALISHIQSMIKDKYISDSERQTYNTRLIEYSTALANVNKKIEECMDSISSSKVDSAKAEIKVTTDAISQNVSNLSQTVSTKADGSTVTAINNKVGSLETSVSGITGKVTNLETTTTNLGNSVSGVQGEVETLKSDVASLEVTTSGISQKVSNVETTTSNLSSEINGVKGNVSNLTTRVSTAESKLTKDSLTTTIGNHYTTSNDVNGIVTSKGYQTQSQVQQTVDGLQVKVQQSGGYNLLRNGCAKNGTAYWSSNGGGISTGSTSSGRITHFSSSFPSGITGEWMLLDPNTDYIYSAKIYTSSEITGSSTAPLHFWCSSTQTSGNSQLTVIDYNNSCKANQWNEIYVHFRTKSGTVHFKPFVCLGGTENITFSVTELMLCKGSIKSPYSPHPSEIYEGITKIDKDGITVTSSNVKSKTSMSANGFKITKTDTNEDVFKVNSDGTLNLKGNITVTGGSIPTSNLSGTITANQIASSAITADKIATGAITANKLSADAINGKTITGSNLRGGTFFTAPNSSETDGYAFRIYNDGRVYSKNIIQVYGTAGNNQYAQLKDGVVTATEYMQTSGYKTEKSAMRWAINDATVVNPTGDNASRIEFATIGDYKYFRPCYNGTVRNGSSSYPWSTVYSKSGVNTTSDRTMKENIVYIDRSKSNETVTTNEMYDFIKNDYVLAQYNYIGEKEEKVSAIAQDLLVNVDGTDNKLGQMIVNSEEVMLANIDGEDAKLSINQTQLLNFTIGALQQAMKKIETLEEEIKNLKKEVV